MGCPVDAVMKKGCGAAHIKNHALTQEIVSETKRGANGLPVSVKTRLGYDRIQTEEWISFLLEQHIDALIIHGRTAKELSKVSAHWDEIGKAVEIRDKISPETIVVGNGDVKDYQMAIEKHREYKVDGVMIGRGIFTNPWVFEKTKKEYTKEDYLTLLLKHAKMFEEKWGKTKNFETMKKFFKMYVTGFEGASELRQELMTCKNYQEVENKIKLPKKITDPT
jgi:tRNA-dihydrouridine synthase